MHQDWRVEGKHRWTLLIVVFVAFAGVERVDLLRGAGPFVLTPNLLLSPIVVTVGASMHFSRKRRGLPTKARSALVMLYLFNILVFLSLSFTTTNLSQSRYMLLVLLIISGWSLIAIVRMTKNYAAIRIGAGLGLFIYVVLDLIQWRTFQHYGMSGPMFSGFLNLQVVPYGDGVVRLAGGLADPNRAAMTVATYTYIILGDPLLRRVKGGIMNWVILLTGFLLVLLTLSRSGLAVFVCILMGPLVTLWRLLSPLQRLVTLGAAVGFGIWVPQGALGVGPIVSSRLSGSVSTSIHMTLLQRGLDTATSDWHFFTGTGFGTSYLQLQDVFPDSKYGNYHSLYISLLVECGIFALMVMLALLIPALLSARRWLALGALIFGIFYLATSDPIFWMQIAMIWALPDQPVVPHSPLKRPRSAVETSQGSAALGT